MYVSYSKNFKKHFIKLHKNIQSRFEIRLKLFLNDRQNPLLNDHILHGKLKGSRSINISGDIRAIYEEKPEQFHFVAIGSHPKFYN